MSVMTIKEISEIIDRMEAEGIDEAVAESARINFSKRLLKTLQESSDNAKDVITGKIEEKMFTHLRSAVLSTTLSVMAMDGNGSFLTLAHMSDELVPYTDSVVLAIIGVLINEEVL